MKINIFNSAKYEVIYRGFKPESSALFKELVK